MVVKEYRSVRRAQIASEVCGVLAAASFAALVVALALFVMGIR